MFFLLLGSIPAVLLAVALWAAYNREAARNRRLLRRLGPTEIRAAQEGPVKIVGTLKLVGQPLRAPLSGRACALWDVVVSDLARYNAIHLHERMARDFLLDDGTGAALVRAAPVSTDAPGSQLALTIVQDAKYTSGFFKEATPELHWFLAQYGETEVLPLGRRRLTYREAVFEPGERIAVYGRARREPDPDAAGSSTGSYRDGPMRLVIEPIDGKLHLSDEPEVVGAPKP